MSTIPDGYMQQMIKRNKEYHPGILEGCLAIVMGGCAGQTIRKHGQRNFGLREKGLFSLLRPAADESCVRGVGTSVAAVIG